jgi:hypothetical protein
MEPVKTGDFVPVWDPDHGCLPQSQRPSKHQNTVGVASPQIAPSIASECPWPFDQTAWRESTQAKVGFDKRPLELMRAFLKRVWQRLAGRDSV